MEEMKKKECKSEYRETELKYTLPRGINLDILIKHLTSKYGIEKIKKGGGWDYFFDPGDKADFIRVRQYDEGGGEFTIKKTDKDSITDRLEINLNLIYDQDITNALELCKLLFGDMTQKIYKKYQVFWLKKETNVVIYTTDVLEIPILEVESESLKEAINIAKELRKDFFMVNEKRSLYDIGMECPKRIKKVPDISSIFEKYVNICKCKTCGDILHSESRHDFVECSCGESFTDGGNDYIRRGGNTRELTLKEYGEHVQDENK